jgi:hypothetical protein
MNNIGVVYDLLGQRQKALEANTLKEHRGNL